jgi:DNA-binding transcriptional regulator YhcF (GntR family)
MHNQNDNIPADVEKRKFTGIWIPAEIWNDEELPALAKLIYAEIASFGSAGCWKKTEELRDPLGISSGTFQKLCRQLKERGYIGEQRRFGRIVRMTTLGFQSSPQKTHQNKNCGVHQAVSCGDEQHNENADQLEYTKNIQRKNSGKSPAKAVKNSEKEQEEFGNHEINEFMQKWTSATGNDLSKNKRERRAAHNLIKSQSKEGIAALLAAVQQIHESGDQYAPAITQPSDLVGQYSKLPKLRLYVAKHAENLKAKKSRLVLDYDGLPPAYEISEADREAVKQKFKEMRKSGEMPFKINKLEEEKDEE